MSETEDRVLAGWESERDTERAKVTTRWFAILLLLSAVFWLRRSDPNVHITLHILGIITIGALLMTLLESIYLWRPGRGKIPRSLKYITVLGDMVFITLLIPYTGYTQSPFFFVYFVFLISNCLRYGLLMSLYVALLFNILYVVALGTAPAGVVHSSVLGGEGLKITAFWAVALYGGSISARLRRQANQLRVYEQTIAELRGRMKAQSAATEDE